MMTAQVEINLGQLRLATCEAFEAIRTCPAVRALDDTQLPVLHAYILGVVMQAGGLTLESQQGLNDIIAFGFADFAAIVKAMPPETPPE